MIFITIMMLIFGVLFIGTLVVRAIKNANAVITGAQYIPGGKYYQDER